MNPNVQKDHSTHSGQATEQPTALEETAEPEGQFPHGLSPNDERPGEPEDGHEGATEEQVGDRTGPGAGYDETAEPQGHQGGQGMGQGRGANAGQQKSEEPRKAS